MRKVYHPVKNDNEEKMKEALGKKEAEILRLEDKVKQLEKDLEEVEEKYSKSQENNRKLLN